jgi:hypothetical protein
VDPHFDDAETGFPNVSPYGYPGIQRAELYDRENWVKKGSHSMGNMLRALNNGWILTLMEFSPDFSEYRISIPADELTANRIEGL